jgi:hypothetical protein
MSVFALDAFRWRALQLTHNLLGTHLQNKISDLTVDLVART